ncbi:transcription factor TFIIIB subunit brf1 [Lambiella insularis]|nr:transcription factor TFIIIB subunit brf1 [Lambiella insularis]
MSAKTKAAAAPKKQVTRIRAVRLDSVKNPQPRRIPPAVQQASAQSGRPASLQCTNRHCPKSDVDEDDGKLVCKTCGVVVQDAQITSEVQFLDMSNGGVAVSGSYVGANEEHARSSAPGNSKIAGGMGSREVSLSNGNNAIRQVADSLRLTNDHKARALKFYTLALNINFVQGREITSVAAVCLYIACRMDSQNRMMLIDFSDALQVNVFRLGQSYLSLVQDLGLREKKGLGELNPEGLIYRFAEELELGSDKIKIAEEAVQILKRMERDWITTGRRPAGVCGAAIILAARMNNYRRTVRELVYIAKVAEITIEKRLEEFKYTDSSKLTVTEFLNHGDKLEKTFDPPAYYKQFLPKKKLRKGKKSGTAEDEMSNPDTERAVFLVSSGTNDRRTSTTPTAQERLDSQAMPPPPVPIDPALLEVSAQRLSELESSRTAGNHDDDAIEGGESVSAGQKRKRGRPLGQKNRPPPTPSSSQIIEENEIESEINSVLEDPEIVSNASALHAEFHFNEPRSPPFTQQSQARSDAPAEEANAQDTNAQEANAQEDETLSDNQLPTPTPAGQPEDVIESTETNSPSAAEQAPPLAPNQRTTEEVLATIPDTEIIPEDEFADDPEVDNCILTQAEIDIRETIWVHDNADYLRARQAKLFRKELAEANGTARVVIKRKRKRGRMGDMSVYQTTNENGEVTGPRTPEEAIAAMRAKRSYSKKINYDAIKQLLGTDSASESGGTSRRGSITTATPAGDRSGASTPRLTVTSPTPSQRAAPDTVSTHHADERSERDGSEVPVLGTSPSHHRASDPMRSASTSIAGDNEDDLEAIIREGEPEEEYYDDDYLDPEIVDDEDVDEEQGSDME